MTEPAQMPLPFPVSCDECQDTGFRTCNLSKSTCAIKECPYVYDCRYPCDCTKPKQTSSSRYTVSKEVVAAAEKRLGTENVERIRMSVKGYLDNGGEVG